MKKLIYFTLTIQLFFGCQNNDDSSANNQVKTYYLKIYNPNAITGVGQIIYDEMNILWTFDFQNQTITIELLNDAEPIVLNSGIHNYSLEEINCGASSNELIINNTYYGDLSTNTTPGVLVIEDLCFSARRLVFNEL